MILLCGNSGSIVLTDVDKEVTIRSLDSKKTLTYGGPLNISKDVIFDNLRLEGPYRTGDYASTTQYDHSGIYANENLLIMGVGIECPDYNESLRYVEIYGGLYQSNPQHSGSCTTDIRLFSGYYSNIIGGNGDQSYHQLDETKITIAGKEVKVLEAVYAGSINGTTDETNVLMVNGSVDTKGYVNNNHNEIEGGFSTIIGGSRYGIVDVESNVEITGNAVVFSVQGGGRTAGSFTETANVTVSGKAEIIQMVCGSITDGNNSNNTPVSQANVTVKDSARVNQVYGGGFDVWVTPDHISTEKVNITIEGSPTIEEVYGGGFRGAVGLSGTDSVHIEITGGIIGSLYGGGRGGEDPLQGTPSGDQTGQAYVNGNISIGIGGNVTIDNVYGGGYGDLDGWGHDDVAKVEGNIVITISDDAKVNGSVYGGGKGNENKEGAAKVTGDIRIGMSGAVIGNISDTGDRVFGGGDLGQVDGGIYIDIGNGSTIYGTIYGGGKGGDDENSGYVQAGNGSVTLLVSDSNVNGSVFGGGMKGSVDADAILIQLENSSVTGAVFGGGMGSTSDSSIAEATSDEIIINLSSTTVGQTSVQYAVFGGGAAAYTTTEHVTINLRNGSTINGDIYGGGYGTLPGYQEPTEADSKPIITNQRDVKILLNGATVNGSIYGGSRAGQDINQETTANQKYGDVHIYLQSGVVMQGVYGGGFLGKSYMNSHIYVGSSAVALTGEAPYIASGSRPDLRLNNIYGGGNLNSPTEADNILLYGTSEISISGGSVRTGSLDFDGYHMPGSGEESNVPKLSIYGDIFGEGNYSLVEGNSTIEIREYNQNNTYYIQSIQRADSVYIGDANIYLDGSADGTSNGVSVLVSLNSIGNLTLEGGVVLELGAQTSGISEFYSMIDSRQATDADYTEGDPSFGNKVILHDGRLLMVLGPDDTGYTDGYNNHTGVIHGYTLLSRAEGDRYYGAFAIGSIDTGVESGFVVENNDGDVEIASFVLGSETSPTKTWYISGHISIGMVLTFEESNNWSASSNTVLPHLTSGSMLAYSASHVEPTVQNGLYILEEQDYGYYVSQTGFNPQEHIGSKDFFSMSVSGSGVNPKSVNVRTHTWYNGELNRYYSEDDYEATGNPGDYSITVSSSLISKDYYGLNSSGGAESVLGTSGNVGTVVVHLAEVTSYTVGGEIRYLPVNMIDVNITLNVQPKTSTYVDVPVTVMTTRTASGFVGTGYIILPSLGSRHSYTVSEYDGDDLRGTFSLFADSTYLSYQGWVSSPFMNSGLTSPLNGSISFGEGGVKDTVMRVEYTGGENAGDGMASFFVNATGSNNTTYHVILNFVEAEDVSLELRYISLSKDVDGNNLEYGLELMYNSGDGGYYSAEWVLCDGYYVPTVISIPYGSVISNESIRYLDGGVVVDGTITDLMDYALTLIEAYDLGSGQRFVYADHLDGWYVYNTVKYDLGSELMEPMVLTAKFGVEVRFHGEGVTISHQNIIITPGTSLNDNNIWNPQPEGSTVMGLVPWDGTGSRSGFHLALNSNGLSYWSESPDSTEAFDFTVPLYSDVDLYIPWIPNEYRLDVIVSGDYPSGILILDGVIDSGTISWSEGTDGRWTANLNVRYGTTVSAGAVDYSGYRILSAYCSVVDGSSVSVSGVPGTTVSFMVPDAGEHEKGRIVLELYIGQGVTVTVGFVGETEFSNALTESMTVTIDGSSLSFYGSEAAFDSMVVIAGENKLMKIKVPSGFWYAVWRGDDLLTDGITGSIGGRVNIESITLDITADSELTIAVYRSVSISEIESGVRGVECIPVDVDGNFSEGQPVSTPYPILFKGYVLDVSVLDGYVLPATQDGTGTGVVDADSTMYTVLGTTNVRITVTQNFFEVTISVTFQDPTGNVQDAGGLSKITDWMVNLVLSDGTEIRVPISEMHYDGSITVIHRVGSVSGTVNVTASASGFQPASSPIIGNTASLSLRAVGYEMRYVSDGQVVYRDTWSVLNTGDVPSISDNNGVTVVVGNSQVWLRYDGDGYSRVSNLTLDLFDSDGLTLHALPPLISEDPGMNEMTIIATQRQFLSGVSVDLGSYDFSIAISDDDGKPFTVRYDGLSNTLTMDGSGTGSIRLRYADMVLIIISVPELVGMPEVSS